MGAQGASPKGAPPQHHCLNCGLPGWVGFSPPSLPPGVGGSSYSHLCVPWRQVSQSICELLQVQGHHPLRTLPHYPFHCHTLGPASGTNKFREKQRVEQQLGALSGSWLAGWHLSLALWCHLPSCYKVIGPCLSLWNQSGTESPELMWSFLPASFPWCLWGPSVPKGKRAPYASQEYHLLKENGSSDP